MAEAKTTKTTGTTVKKSTSKSSNFFEGMNIQDFFEKIRSTFMDTMKDLTSYQKEFEKIVSDFNTKGKKYQEEITKVFKSWYGTLQNVHEQIGSIAKNNFKSFMPSNLNLPFAVEYEKLTSQMNDMFKKFFSAFPVFNK